MPIIGQRALLQIQGFLPVFLFPVLIGDITQLGKKPEAIAISQNLAKRFWGENWMQQAISSTVIIHDNGDFTVEAVYENLPKHSFHSKRFLFQF